jgi:hypothetical protein
MIVVGLVLDVQRRLRRQFSPSLRRYEAEQEEQSKLRFVESTASLLQTRRFKIEHMKAFSIPLVFPTHF